MSRWVFYIAILLILVGCTKRESDSFYRFYFRNDGADIAVQIDGNINSNTFILLLHGGPGGGSSAYNQGYFADKLEENYAVVYMDQRGNGATQGSYSQADLTLAQNSDDVYQLTRFLKKKYGEDISIFLMGHSWGGITTAHALINTAIQEDLKGWINIDGAYDFERNDIEAIKLFQEVGQTEIDAGNNLEFWQDILQNVNGMDTLNVTSDNQGYLNSKGFEAEGKLSQIAQPELDESGPAYGLLSSPDFSLALYMSNQVVNPILNEDSQNNPQTEELYNITIPSQFLYGKYDFVVPPQIGVIAYNRVSSVSKEIVIFENSGHSPMVNEPILFTQEVIDFIETHK